jgi:hypothetical protein
MRNTQIYCVDKMQNFLMLKHLVHIVTAYFIKISFDHSCRQEEGSNNEAMRRLIAPHKSDMQIWTHNQLTETTNLVSASPNENMEHLFCLWRQSVHED